VKGFGGEIIMGGLKMSDTSLEKNFDEIFQSVIEIEKMAAEIYEEFAKLFSDFPKIADFWKGMNRDEIDHAKWLIEMKESLPEEVLSSSPDYDLILKVHSIKKSLGEYSEKKINSLDDAYELANDIESSEVNNLFRLFTHKFISSEDKKNFILSEINDHQLKTMNFPKNFGDKILRKEIKAERN
jgi:rubrerythrin